MKLGIRKTILPIAFVASVATMTACGNNKSNSNTSNMPAATHTDVFTHSTSADIPPKVADHFIFRMMESADVKQEPKIAPAINNRKTAGNFIFDLMTLADTSTVKKIFIKK